MPDQTRPPDIATERALERSLKELSDLKYALDQSAIVATTDVHGLITYANDKFCQISKYSREELLGQDHRIINSAYHPKEFIRDLWRTIASGRVWRSEIRNRAKDGSIYWVDTTIVPFMDARGKPYQYIAIRYDITERKAAEERLREQAAFVRLGQMAAVVAHEVKNPLAGLRGALQVIGKRLPAGSPDTAIVGEMVARIDALNRMVQDLLLFARPRQPKMAPVRIAMVVREAVEFIANDPGLKHTPIGVDDGGDPVISADVDLLRPVFLNLLLNAAQAAQNRGGVRVRIHPRQNGVCRITIEDDGPGIAAEIRDRIFQPFFTTKHRGTGLGLPIAKRAVELHGGELLIESPEGGGTTVTVRLPLEERLRARSL
ncbi:MAG: PAS domain S-box protein [Acidobacteria bacterium]|nr:PAS domain S-box protein [Acidobacteriota bacterium]MBI3264963.1 PAS domain S-box protein [Acidobacteriota bacterium]